MVAKFLDHNIRELKNDGGDVLSMAKKKKKKEEKKRETECDCSVTLSSRSSLYTSSMSFPG